MTMSGTSHCRNNGEQPFKRRTRENRKVGEFSRSPPYRLYICNRERLFVTQITSQCYSYIFAVLLLLRSHTLTCSYQHAFSDLVFHVNSAIALESLKFRTIRRLALGRLFFI